MAQFQPQVPDPLGNDLPALLTPGVMAAPTVGFLLSVFIRERIFKSAAMQIEGDHVALTYYSIARHEKFHLFLFLLHYTAPGQIIDWDHEAGPSRVLASGFLKVLSTVADDLEAGKYEDPPTGLAYLLRRDGGYSKILRRSRRTRDKKRKETSTEALKKTR